LRLIIILKDDNNPLFVCCQGAKAQGNKEIDKKEMEGSSHTSGIPRSAKSRYSGSPRGQFASNERYPWRFAGARIERGPLPAGDYALMDGDDIMALVQPKTTGNHLADFGIMLALHQRLAKSLALMSTTPS